jgi:sugar O-acyltransferase (sialic acid O-acetyltransferase NeuD family)
MKDLVIFGTGGFAREVLQIVEDINEKAATWNLVGFLDEDRTKWNSTLQGLPVLGDTAWLERNPHVAVSVAIGSPADRRKVVLTLEHVECSGLALLVHPLAWISKRVEIGPGTVLDAGALVSPDARIGRHVILNNNCTVGHDTVLEDFVTVAPGASIAGEAHVSEGCDLGINCTVVQGIAIGHWSIVGAGAVVVRHLPPNVTAVGVPAQVIKERPEGWQDRR